MTINVHNVDHSASRSARHRVSDRYLSEARKHLSTLIGWRRLV
jgi:hypothetical protein